MTVTKQQQLEWLAGNGDCWPGFMDREIRMCTVMLGWPNQGLGYHTITKQEWQQERDKMSSKPAQDNSWHERGELPPVGCECWHILEGKQVFIVAKHCSIDAVIFSSAPGAGELFYGYGSDFHPIRTERENAIDDISSYFCDADGFQVTPHATDLIAARIYDAGYRKAKS